MDTFPATRASESVARSQLQKQRQQWQSLLLAIQTIQAVFTLGAGVFYGLVAWFSQIATLVTITEIVVLHFVLTLATVLMLRVVRKRPDSKLLEVATILAVASFELDIFLATLVVGSYCGITAMFFWPPILVTVIGLSSSRAIATTVLSIVCTVSAVFLQSSGVIVPATDIAKDFPFINAFFWAITLLMVMAGLVIFRRQLDAAFRAVSSYATQQEASNAKLLEINQFGAGLSNSLAVSLTELNTTSNQHTSAVQEQVAAVQEVTSSLEELGETARQIAHSAKGASESAFHMVAITAQVNEGGEKAKSYSEQGETAVEESVKSVASLRDRIELMGQRMLNVTTLTGRVNSIVSILDEIAGETHLLALNASIEAAGSIGMGSDDNGGTLGNTRSNVRGERFGVIAQEIKNLADRSRESTEEARQILTEMQGAVAAATLVAEEGKKATTLALAHTQIAGGVIEKLNEVIRDMVTQFQQVLDASQLVKLRSEEISLATTQQRSANEQIVQTMRSVAEVSAQSASAIRQISYNVAGVKERIDELNTVLKNNADTFRDDDLNNPPSQWPQGNLPDKGGEVRGVRAATLGA